MNQARKRTCLTKRSQYFSLTVPIIFASFNTEKQKSLLGSCSSGMLASKTYFGLGTCKIFSTLGLILCLILINFIQEKFVFLNINSSVCTAEASTSKKKMERFNPWLNQAETPIITTTTTTATTRININGPNGYHV